MAGSSRVPLRGEVWRVLMPGRPRDPHQPRPALHPRELSRSAPSSSLGTPALCVSADVRNRNRDHALFVPIYSRGRPGPTRVVLSRGMGGVPHDSIAFCEEVTTLDFDFLAEGPLGDVVPERVLREAVLAIRRAVGDVVLDSEARGQSR